MKKTSVYVVHSNRHDFIPLQHRTLTKFLAPPFEMVVVNNARETADRAQIDDQATELGLNVINVHSDTPFSLCGLHHADALNHVWQNHARHLDGFVMLMDGDMFLLSEFNIPGYMGDHPIAGAYQRRATKYHYITPAIVILNPSLLPNSDMMNWAGTCVEGVHLDTGGGLYNYLTMHPEIKQNVKEMFQTWNIKASNNNKHLLPNEVIDDYQDDFNVEIYNNIFLHYCRSSNWDWQSDTHHYLKTAWVNKFIGGALNDTIKPKITNFMISESQYFGWD